MEQLGILHAGGESPGADRRLRKEGNSEDPGFTNQNLGHPPSSYSCSGPPVELKLVLSFRLSCCLQIPLGLEEGRSLGSRWLIPRYWPTQVHILTESGKLCYVFYGLHDCVFQCGQPRGTHEPHNS